ncbi:MAG: XRE family transcriptional regulator [Chloroflexi bacterium]|nr:XRE family transcriptional regulator [Chloroflexota bacterium]
MIFGDRIRQARQLGQFTQAQLADALKVSQSAIARMENGRLAPSDELVRAIATETGFPSSFFAQPPDEDVPLGSLLFRAKAAASARTETTAYRYAQLGFRIIRSLLAKTKPIRLLLAKLDDEDPEVAAQITRANLRLAADEPVPNLINVLELSGVIVLSLPTVLKGVDAFSMWASDGIPFIVLSSSDQTDGARLRYSVAHEVAHLVLHQTLTGGVPELEEEANRFAGELLFPERAFLSNVDRPVTLSGLARHKIRWGLSLQALVMRAKELGLLTSRQKTYLFQQLSSKGWRLREPPNLDVHVESPRTLVHLAELHYGDPINYEDLARDVNLSGHFVEKFVTAQEVPA